MDLPDYISGLSGDDASSRPLDIDRPRAITFDLDSDDDVARYAALTDGEHADSYRTQTLAYDEDENSVTTLVAPAADDRDPGEAVKEGYTLLHDLNRGRLPRQLIGDEAYAERYGGSTGSRDQGSSRRSFDVLEHMVGEGLYEQVKKAAS